MLNRARKILGRALKTSKEKGKTHLAKKKIPGVEDQLILSFAAGRSGQRWMNTIFTSHENCSGGCDRMTYFEAFYRYVTWYNLPIDLEGFYQQVDALIKQDLEVANLSIYSTPYFSFGIKELVERFAPQFVMYHVRDPIDVINSNYVKGWYSGNHTFKNREFSPGPQPLSSDKLHRSFGRIVPNDDYYEEWCSLTQIGKITWYYVTINQFIYNRIQEINGPRKWYVKLSEVDQNYDYYRMLAAEFSLSPIMSKDEFLSLKGGMSNKAKTRRKSQSWSALERKEYEMIIEPFQEVYSSIRSTGI